MKRILVIIAVLAATMLGAAGAAAQINGGVIGGLTFSSSNVKEIDRGTMTQYHVGATMRFKLPRGFSVQPSLIYNVKGAKTEVLTIGSEVKAGYLELPVSFQWGPDLLLFRPFFDVTPFVGCALNNSLWSELTGTFKNVWADGTRWEYGLGVGGGLEIWKIQVIARYNWNFNPVAEDVRVGGVTLSLAFLF